MKSARKAKDKLHKPFKERQELVSEALHRQKQNRIRMASMRESRDSDRFLVNTQVQLHALLRRGFGTSVPFIMTGSLYSCMGRRLGTIIVNLSFPNCGHHRKV